MRYDMITILNGDALEMLKTLPDESANCCVTSPPYYGLRNYGVDGQIGLESTPEQYIERLVAVFREVRRVLCKDGTLWLNIGDSYATGTKADRQQSSGLLKRHTAQDISRIGMPEGLKTKDLIGIPWMLAFALRADGWFLRQDIIWAKPNPMPESVRDRCTKSHEYIFLLTKSARYCYDAEAIAELAMPDDSIRDRDNTKLNNTPGRTKMSGLKINDYTTRNRRSVWTITTKPYTEAHFATFPPELPRICIMAGCLIGGTVLDPFAGSGTTGKVALELGRKAILIELNEKYVDMIERRTQTTVGMAI